MSRRAVEAMTLAITNPDRMISVPSAADNEYCAVLAGDVRLIDTTRPTNRARLALLESDGERSLIPWRRRGAVESMSLGGTRAIGPVVAVIRAGKALDWTPRPPRTRTRDADEPTSATAA